MDASTSRFGPAPSGAGALPALPGHALQARAAAWLRMATVAPEIDSGELQVVARVLNGATVAEALLQYYTVVAGIPVTREGSTYRRGGWTRNSPAGALSVRVCVQLCIVAMIRLRMHPTRGLLPA